ncbi:MAG TPA: hypothetical protein VG944_09680 [Fimbriimonas sp.]|nr:hypothetical protein [Fimbriimonas sp.]
MTTIGDVLAVVAILVGLGLTSWALMISLSLLFPERVMRAKGAAEEGVWKSAAIGAAFLLVGTIGFIMAVQPLPMIRLVGWVVTLAVLSCGALGAAGLGHVAGNAIRRMSPDMPEYPAFVRGSAFLVTASMLPVFGWLAFGPAVLIVSIGCGVRALRDSAAETVVAR